MAYQFSQTGQEIQDILDQVGINTGNIATNTSDISALNATLTQFINGFSASPTAPTAYSSRAGTIEGGYIRIGNVVIVAVRFIALTANSSAAVYLQGLPRPNATIVLTGGLPNNNANVFSYVNASGQIGLGAVSANTQATVMGVYLAS